MDFSETYRFSHNTPAFSPNGKYIAAATEYRLVIRDALTTQVVQIYSCIDKVFQIQWCPNSTYVLCGLAMRAIVQVWSVFEPDWTCKIDEGIAGVEAVQWTPDGLHILVVAEFQIRYCCMTQHVLCSNAGPDGVTMLMCRITIWSLTNKNFLYISGPKSSGKGMRFSPDGKYMAVAEVLMSLLHMPCHAISHTLSPDKLCLETQRKACKDCISMYTCADWQLAHHFQLATADLEDIAWSPDCACLVAWDTCLTYKLVVFAPNGEMLTSYSAYQNALGIKSVAWSPSGQLLAVGSFDQACQSA